MLKPESGYRLTEPGPLGQAWDSRCGGSSGDSQLCDWRWELGFSAISRGKITFHSWSQGQYIPLVRCHLRKGLQEPSRETAGSALE